MEALGPDVLRTQPLQELQHRLLDKAVQHTTQLPHSLTIRLRNFHSPYRLRLIGPVSQLFPDF